MSQPETPKPELRPDAKEPFNWRRLLQELLWAMAFSAFANKIAASSQK